MALFGSFWSLYCTKWAHCCPSNYPLASYRSPMAVLEPARGPHEPPWVITEPIMSPIWPHNWQLSMTLMTPFCPNWPHRGLIWGPDGSMALMDSYITLYVPYCTFVSPLVPYDLMSPITLEPIMASLAFIKSITHFNLHSYAEMLCLLYLLPTHFDDHDCLSILCLIPIT